MDESKETLARTMFNASYNRLSAFGQDEVDRAFRVLNSHSNTPIKENNDLILNETLDERISMLNRRVSNLEIENEELWIENSELKSELATLRAEINHGTL